MASGADTSVRGRVRHCSTCMLKHERQLRHLIPKCGEVLNHPSVATDCVGVHHVPRRSRRRPGLRRRGRGRAQRRCPSMSADRPRRGVADSPVPCRYRLGRRAGFRRSAGGWSASTPAPPRPPANPCVVAIRSSPFPRQMFLAKVVPLLLLAAAGPTTRATSQRDDFREEHLTGLSDGDG